MEGTDALVRASGRSEATQQAIANAAELWAKATTNLDTRRTDDCQRIKKKAVADFLRVDRA